MLVSAQGLFSDVKIKCYTLTRSFWLKIPTNEVTLLIALKLARALRDLSLTGVPTIYCSKFPELLAARSQSSKDIT